MKDIFAADYASKEALANAIDDNGEFFPDRVELETITGEKLSDVVKLAKTLNYSSPDECYRVRRLIWETKLNQYTPDEYFDCNTLQSLTD